MKADLQVEATGETVGEAKWQALRELEALRPGLDKSAVRFQVVSEGQRGLLGVGFSPARVVASVAGGELTDAPELDEAGSEPAADIRELVQGIASSLGIHCRVTVTEDEETITATCTGPDLGLLIGKHGQTLDAIQYLLNAIAHRGDDRAKYVVVDAAGYRERRRVTLEGIALRAAERVRSGEERVELEPMSAPERKIVHMRLQAEEGLGTESEGDEPNRFVVVRGAQPGDE